MAEVPTLKLLTRLVPAQLNDRKDAFYEHLIQNTAIARTYLSALLPAFKQLLKPKLGIQPTPDSEGQGACPSDQDQIPSPLR